MMAAAAGLCRAGLRVLHEEVRTELRAASHSANRRHIMRMLPGLWGQMCWQEGCWVELATEWPIAQAGSC